MENKTVDMNTVILAARYVEILKFLNPTAEEREQIYKHMEMLKQLMEEHKSNQAAAPAPSEPEPPAAA